MKKYLKFFSAVSLCLMLSFGFTSCSDDGYSLDRYWVNIATITDLGNNTYYFTLDDSTKLWVAVSATSYKPKSKRVIINYTILGDRVDGYDHSIKLNGYVADIPIKNIIYVASDDLVKQDSIGNDPIQIISMWEGGGYLNVRFKYNMGGVNAHLLNLVSASPDLSAGDDVVKLELRHNQNSDPQYRPAEGYMDFDLAPYRIANRDKVNFEISVKDISGETKIYRVEYKYEDGEIVVQ